MLKMHQYVAFICKYQKLDVFLQKWLSDYLYTSTDCILMGKCIKINEDIEQELISDMLCEVFYPKAEKVLLVKDYLDKNFAKQEMDDIDSNGYPKKDKVVVMLSANKQPLKTMTPSQLLTLLDDKFNNMITADDDRKKFLKQVIIDWYGNKITKQGLLTANFL